jgi:uncharacterized protein YciI
MGRSGDLDLTNEEETDMGRDLESYELVFLRRAPNPPEMDDETLDQLQLEHLAHKDRLREAGILAANGPVLDQPDESLRGMSFYRTGSLDEARRLAEEDPSVIAGRLVVEVMTWWTAPGSFQLPGRAFTLD